MVAASEAPACLPANVNPAVVEARSFWIALARLPRAAKKNRQRLALRADERAGLAEGAHPDRRRA